MHSRYININVHNLTIEWGLHQVEQSHCSANVQIHVANVQIEKGGYANIIIDAVLDVLVITQLRVPYMVYGHEQLCNN